MSKLSDEIRRLMLQAEGELPEANPTWMGMKIDLFSDEVVFDGLARCAGYVKKEVTVRRYNSNPVEILEVRLKKANKSKKIKQK